MIEKLSFTTGLKSVACERGMLEKEVNYIQDKGEEFIKLITSLENEKLVTLFDEKERQEIGSEIQRTILNHYQMNSLYLSFINMIENNNFSKTTMSIKLKDELGNEYYINMEQIVTVFALTCCSQVEVMYNMLKKLLDFAQFKTSKGKKIKEPTGLGGIIKILNDREICGVSFFDDIDTKIRNSFYHLDYKTVNKKIYCEHEPNRYDREDCISLEELHNLIMQGDRSVYTLMFGLMHYGKYQ